MKPFIRTDSASKLAWIATLILIAAVILIAIGVSQGQARDATGDTSSDTTNSAISSSSEPDSLLSREMLARYQGASAQTDEEVVFSALEDDGRAGLSLMMFFDQPAQRGSEAGCLHGENLAGMSTLIREHGQNKWTENTLGCWDAFETNKGMAMLVRFANGEVRYWTIEEIPNLVRNTDWRGRQG